MSKTVAEWSERMAFGSRDSELAAKIQARFTNCPPPDPSFLIASSLWIAELEDIQGLNSKLLAELQQLSCLELDIYV